MSNPLTPQEVDTLKQKGHVIGMDSRLTPVLQYLTGPYTVHRGAIFQRGDSYERGDVIFYRNEYTNEFIMATPESPIHTAHIQTLYANRIQISADSSDKSNLRIIENVLDTIDEIRSYMNEEEFRIGLIAEELEAAYPEAVTTDPETGKKSIDYSAITALLWKAMKELKYKHQDSLRDNAVKAGHIKQLRDEVADLKKDIETMKEQMRSLYHTF